MKLRSLAVLALMALSLSLAGAAPADAPAAYDVVVIGSGGGGLGAAATLAQAGVKTLVLEQHYQVGGYMSGFERGPYTFDVSLHAINGLDPDDGTTRILFGRLGIMDRIKPVRLDPAYTVQYPDFSLTVPADPMAYKALLLKKFPRERLGIENFFAVMDTMHHAILALNAQYRQDAAGALKLILQKPWFMVPLQTYRDRTLTQFLDAQGLRDPKLRAVLSWMCGYAGASPDDFPAELFLGMFSSYHYCGFYYFEGGSRSISRALAEVVVEHGGEILTGTRAAKIELEDGHAVAVVASDGRRFPCRWVVSNASAPATLFEMVGRQNLPPDYVRLVERMKVGPSLFQLYLGVDHDYRPAFAGGHTISVFESYDLSHFVEQSDPEKNGFFMVNYSVLDPGAAPPGKNVIGITSYMPYDWNEGWRESAGPEAYRLAKEQAARAFIRQAEKLLPGLSSHIEVQEIGSPRTMEHYTLNPRGAVYGWKIDVAHYGRHRLAQETPVPNLFLAGAWTRPGHGQSTVLESGVQAADLIIASEVGKTSKK